VKYIHTYIHTQKQAHTRITYTYFIFFQECSQKERPFKEINKHKLSIFICSIVVAVCCTCMCMCTYVCMYMSMCECRIYVIYTHIHIPSPLKERRTPCRGLFLRSFTYMCMHMHQRIPHTLMNTRTHTHTYTYTYIHAHTDTNTHTHTCT